MFKIHTSVPSSLTPEELTILQNVFDKECERRGFQKNSPEAVDLAELLMSIFQKGQHNEQQLLSALINSDQGGSSIYTLKVDAAFSTTTT